MNQSHTSPPAPGLSEASARTRHAGPLEPPSILVLTKDEEVNIEACLETAAFSDDIVILDSFSSDRTLELARRYPNVRVYQRPFDTEFRQRNFALHEIEYKHPWVYISDADERITPELRNELLSIASNPADPHAAYRLRYRNMFHGRWIRRSTGYPVWIIRLVRPKQVHYEVRATNVHPIANGSVGELQSHFVHYSFNTGLRRWFEKHNFYSDKEAEEAVTVRRKQRPRVRDLSSRDPMAARRAVKNWSFFLRGRALWRFLYMYLMRLGLLDGRAGFHYAAMVSMYEYWLELKIIECERAWGGRTEDVVRQRMRGVAPLVEGHRSYEGDPTGGIDILIPTLNEAAHITEAVTNARQLGNVYVLDSFSSDGTQELARAAGATVIEHPFENYSRQKNWGLDHLPFTGKWVFILDADERITPELLAELRERAARDDVAGYYVNRVVIFMGREIRHGGLFPSWNLRFFQRGKARYEDRAVHEHMICDGPTAHLRCEMLHIRRESIHEYIRKHIRYADMESEEWVRMRLGHGGERAGRLFRRMLRLRQWLRRAVWPRTPARPLIRFVYMYFARLGVLDGRAGLHLALLMASYEYMISMLYRDKLEQIRRGLRAPPGAGRPK
jgi:glycosyltransferase involved in cell wall biosynthesis